MWLAYTGNQALDQGRQLRAQIDRLEDAVASGDLAAAADQIQPIRESARELESQTSGAPWWVLARLPVVGPTVSAVQDLASGAVRISDSAKPLVSILNRATDGGLRTPDGAIDLALLADAQQPLADLAQTSDEVAQEISAINPTLVQGDVRPLLEKAQRVLPDLASGLQGASQAAERIPAMVGADGPRRWLILEQNLAEVRGTGGLPGAYVVVDFSATGEVTIVEQGINNTLPAEPIPLAGVPEESLALWGSNNLNDWSAFNQTRDYPLAARIAANGFARGGTPVDDVMMLDQHAVAALLAGTGPITVTGPDGAKVSVNADNAAAYLTIGVYEDYPDSADKDRVVEAILAATIRQALTQSLDLPALVLAMADPVREGRLLAWSQDAQTQEWLAATAASGIVPEAPGPYVAVAFNNGAGNKADAYVTATVDYSVGVCRPPVEGQTRSSVRITLTNDIPEGVPGIVDQRLDDPQAPSGSTKMLVALYGPVGSTLRVSTLDLGPVPYAGGVERGHPVWTYVVPLERGQTRAIDVQFDEPVTSDEQPVLSVQPLYELPAVSLQGPVEDPPDCE